MPKITLVKKALAKKKAAVTKKKAMAKNSFHEFGNEMKQSGEDIAKNPPRAVIKDIKFKSNRAAVQAQMNSSIMAALEEIGKRAEEIGKMEIAALGAVDTGHLERSMGYEVGHKCVTIGNTAEYAPFVELGTVKMGARPFLRNTINNHRGEFQAILEAELKKGFKGS